LEKLNILIAEYLENTNKFLEKYAYPLTTENIELFKLNQTKYYEKFNGKTWEDVFVDLFRPQIYETWDNYSLAYTFLSLQKIIMTSVLNNANMDTFIDIWKSIILSGPEDRKTVEKTLEEVDKINVLEYVASQQNWKCGNCKEQLSAWFEVDHKVRLERGGSNEVSNLVALCRECHGEKTAMENL
jgi:hypothetical protein